MNQNHRLIATCNDKVIWKLELEKHVYYSSPAVDDDGTIYISTGIYLGTDWGSLYAVNPDGTEKWHSGLDYEDEMAFSCPAIEFDGTIYIGAERHYSGFVYAFNPDGTKKWKYAVEGQGRTVRASPTIGADGTIYIATKSGGYDVPAKIIALSPSGVKQWEFIVETFHGPGAADDVYSTPSIGADGMIYFGSENEHFYAVNPDGTLNWRIQVAHSINWSSAAILPDGTIYVGTHHENPPNKGNLYAIRSTSMGYALTPWPRFRQNNKNNGRYNGL